MLEGHKGMDVKMVACIKRVTGWNEKNKRKYISYKSSLCPKAPYGSQSSFPHQKNKANMLLPFKPFYLGLQYVTNQEAEQKTLSFRYLGAETVVQKIKSQV